MSLDFHIHEYIWSFLVKMNWISVLLALGIIFFCTAEVWYISQGTAGHNLILVRFPFIFFDIFNSNKFCFGNSTRKHGLLFSAKKYWAIRFLNCFFWNINIFVKIRYVEIKSCTVRLFVLICLQNFPYHIQNNVSHKYLSTLINLLLCCLYGILYNTQPVQPVLVLQLHVFRHNAPLALITLGLKKGKNKAFPF